LTVLAVDCTSLACHWGGVSPDSGIEEDGSPSNRPDTDGGTAPIDGEAAGDAPATIAPEALAVADLKRAGLARGSVVCACVSPALSPADLPGCAIAESGPAEVLFGADGERCVLDLARDDPTLRDYLECKARRLVLDAECVKQSCPAPPSSDCPGMQGDCSLSAVTEALWVACRAAFYCGDRRADVMRCNDVFECPDRSDEIGCGPGRIICDDDAHLALNLVLCDNHYGNSGPCVAASACAPGASGQAEFACGDGAVVPLARVCNGENDCLTGRDERSCAP
jgi:hypothetical protein